MYRNFKIVFDCALCWSK